MPAYNFSASVSEHIAKETGITRGKGRSERVEQLLLKGLEFEKYYENRNQNNDVFQYSCPDYSHDSRTTFAVSA